MKNTRGAFKEDAFIASSLNALLYELEKNGYFMMVKATTEWNEIIRFASMWNMDGLVLIGFCDSDYEKLRDNMHIPFVVYDGYFEENSRICNLTIANEEGGYQVGSYLYGLGHRRILCVSDNCVCVDKERMDGCRRGMEDAEVDFWEVPMTQEERIAFYREHLEALRTYTAVFVVSDVYAIELMQFAQANGIQVPKQLSIVGFDNIGLCEKVHPTLTTVGQNPARRAGGSNRQRDRPDCSLRCNIGTFVCPAAKATVQNAFFLQVCPRRARAVPRYSCADSRLRVYVESR